MSEHQEEIELDLPEEFDVAIVVLVRCAGADSHDAANRARSAIQNKIGTEAPLPHRQGIIKDKIVRFVDVIEVGAAGANGYIWTKPTSKAYRQAGLDKPNGEPYA